MQKKILSLLMPLIDLLSPFFAFLDFIMIITIGGSLKDSLKRATIHDFLLGCKRNPL